MPAAPLDLTRRFLPEALARTAPLAFLGAGERRVLNQLRGRTYVVFATFVTTLQLRASPIAGAPTARRALALLRPIAAELAASFGREPAPFDRDDHAGIALLSSSPLAAALASAYLGGAVQVHHEEALVDGGLEPGFQALLANLWRVQAEQVQRFERQARELARAVGARERALGIEICRAGARHLDALLAARVDHDLAAFTALTGRRLGERECERARRVQHQAVRWTHLGAGLTHPCFVHLVGDVAGEHARSLATLGESFL